MVARIWKGQTPIEMAEDYQSYLLKTGISDYENSKGNRGALVFNRQVGERSEFTLISFWESTEAIRRFSGFPIERARYYPEDINFLTYLEPEVSHYDVVHSSKVFSFSPTRKAETMEPISYGFIKGLGG